MEAFKNSSVAFPPPLSIALWRCKRGKGHAYQQDEICNPLKFMIQKCSEKTMWYSTPVRSNYIKD